MSKGKDSGILEIIAIGAIVYFMWKVTRKKITIPLSEEKLTIEETCKNIVYKPLSPMEPRQATLLGKGYCYSGDLKYSDYSQGSGDPYAEQQAEEYTERKNEEAIRDINRKVIQFRLINTSAVAITTKVLDTIQDSVPFSPIPSAPVAGSATSVTATGFTANWNAVTGATKYYLDISTDAQFNTYIVGYQNLDVSNVLTYLVTGLDSGVNYYYRVRSSDDIQVSSNSNIITLLTIGMITDIDGNVYTSIVIYNVDLGKWQEWLVENYKLNYTGSKVYDNNEANRDEYGGLYTYAMATALDFCIDGWRLPTSPDWFGLLGVANDTVNGGYMKEAGLTHWNTPNTGADNSSGLTMRGNGYFWSQLNGFYDLKNTAYIWFSDGDSGDTTTAYGSYLLYSQATEMYISMKKTDYLGVRLMRDIEI